MPYLNEQEKQLFNVFGERYKPKFSLVVAFDYYDGLERGFALFPSGEGLVISSMGDSRSRLFRAFRLKLLGGNWSNKVQAIVGEQKFIENRMIVPQKPTDLIDQFEREVFLAKPDSHYIAVGSPNIDWLIIAPIETSQLPSWYRANNEASAFDLAHKFIKRLYK